MTKVHSDVAKWYRREGISVTPLLYQWVGSGDHKQSATMEPMTYRDPQDPRLLEARRKHYRDNPEPYKQRARAHMAEKRDFIRAHKETPCADCGVEYPWYVMEFDHLPERGDKVCNLAVAHNLGWNKIREELEKCEVVCGNCHKIRTYMRACAGHPTGSNPEGEGSTPSARAESL